MKDVKYRKLAEKKEKMIEWAEFSEKAICEKMERVRLQHNYSRIEFSELLGYPPSKYSSIVQYKRSKMTVSFFLRFCYLFKYDISHCITDASSQSDLDRATYEIAAILSSMTPEGIRELSNAINGISSRTLPVTSYRRLTIALRKLRKLLESQTL